MKTKSNKELWWLTRVFSGLLIIFSLFMFIGETWFGENPGKSLTINAILQLSVTGIGLLGLLVAWKWELTGALISLIAFITLAGINSKILIPSLLYIWPVTAALFIILWIKSKKTTSTDKSFHQIK